MQHSAKGMAAREDRHSEDQLLSARESVAEVPDLKAWRTARLERMHTAPEYRRMEPVLRKLTDYCVRRFEGEDGIFASSETIAKGFRFRGQQFAPRTIKKYLQLIDKAGVFVSESRYRGLGTTGGRTTNRRRLNPEILAREEAFEAITVSASMSVTVSSGRSSNEDQLEAVVPTEQPRSEATATETTTRATASAANAAPAAEEHVDDAEAWKARFAAADDWAKSEGQDPVMDWESAWPPIQEDRRASVDLVASPLGKSRDLEGSVSANLSVDATAPLRSAASGQVCKRCGVELVPGRPHACRNDDEIPF